MTEATAVEEIRSLLSSLIGNFAIAVGNTTTDILNAVSTAAARLCEVSPYDDPLSARNNVLCVLDSMVLATQLAQANPEHSHWTLSVWSNIIRVIKAYRICIVDAPNLQTMHNVMLTMNALAMVHIDRLAGDILASSSPAPPSSSSSLGAHYDSAKYNSFCQHDSAVVFILTRLCACIGLFVECAHEQVSGRCWASVFILRALYAIHREQLLLHGLDSSAIDMGIGKVDEMVLKALRRQNDVHTEVDGQLVCMSSECYHDEGFQDICCVIVLAQYARDSRLGRLISLGAALAALAILASCATIWQPSDGPPSEIQSQLLEVRPRIAINVFVAAISAIIIHNVDGIVSDAMVTGLFEAFTDVMVELVTAQSSGSELPVRFLDAFTIQLIESAIKDVHRAVDGVDPYSGNVTDSESTAIACNPSNGFMNRLYRTDASSTMICSRLLLCSLMSRLTAGAQEQALDLVISLYYLTSHKFRDLRVLRAIAWLLRDLALVVDDSLLESLLGSFFQSAVLGRSTEVSQQRDWAATAATANDLLLPSEAVEILLDAFLQIKVSPGNVRRASFLRSMVSSVVEESLIWGTGLSCPMTKALLSKQGCSWRQLRACMPRMMSIFLISTASTAGRELHGAATSRSLVSTGINMDTVKQYLNFLAGSVHWVLREHLQDLRNDQFTAKVSASIPASRAYVDRLIEVLMSSLAVLKCIQLSRMQLSLVAQLSGSELSMLFATVHAAVQLLCQCIELSQRNGLEYYSTKYRLAFDQIFRGCCEMMQLLSGLVSSEADFQLVKESFLSLSARALSIFASSNESSNEGIATFSQEVTSENLLLFVKSIAGFAQKLSKPWQSHANTMITLQVRPVIQARHKGLTYSLATKRIMHSNKIIHGLPATSTMVGDPGESQHL